MSRLDLSQEGSLCPDVTQRSPLAEKEYKAATLEQGCNNSPDKQKPLSQTPSSAIKILDHINPR